MKKMKLFVLLLTCILVSLPVYADGLSMQIKRTNPGIAGEKGAELIFDVVNTDMTHKIEGFIWCKSPDDATVSSTMGAASGSGAQYVSQKFFMDEGPSQKAITLTLESQTIGDKNTGCIFKYTPYKETSKVVETTETINGSEIKTQQTLTERKYLKMNGEYVDEASDSIFRELRLDKTVPFVKGMSNPECPEGKTDCKSSEVTGGMGGYLYLILLILAVLIVLGFIYKMAFGKNSA